MRATVRNIKSASNTDMYLQAMKHALPVTLLFFVLGITVFTAYPFSDWGSVQFILRFPSITRISGLFLISCYVMPFVLVYKLFSFLWDRREADLLLSAPHSRLSLCFCRLLAVLTCEIIGVILPLLYRTSIVNKLLLPVKWVINIAVGNFVLMLFMTACSLAAMLAARRLLTGIFAGLSMTVLLQIVLVVLKRLRFGEAGKAVYAFFRNAFCAFDISYIQFNDGALFHGYFFAVIPVLSAVILAICFVLIKKRGFMPSPGFRTDFFCILSPCLILVFLLFLIFGVKYGAGVGLFSIGVICIVMSFVLLKGRKRPDRR